MNVLIVIFSTSVESTILHTDVAGHESYSITIGVCELYALVTNIAFWYTVRKICNWSKIIRVCIEKSNDLIQSNGSFVPQKPCDICDKFPFINS